MSKSKPSPIIHIKPPVAVKPVPAKTASSHAAATREFIESIAIAFVLAFLFRTFEAEAFVIPTGSMAPTLLGRHKDVVCPKCGFEFVANAAEEVEYQRRENLMGLAHQNLPEMYEIYQCVCPECRASIDVMPGNPQRELYPSYSGDRIIVDKFAYQFADPKRWDVIVFKYPDRAFESYIKRLIGLPGETVRIHRGDLSISKDGGATFEIISKPADKRLATLQTVFDNDYTPKMLGYGFPARWNPVADDNRVWSTSDHVTYVCDGKKADSPAWIRYSHLTPTIKDWFRVPKAGRPVAPIAVQPVLIRDFAAYNASRMRRDVETNPIPRDNQTGLNWVGDLAVQCECDASAGEGVVILELVKGGRRFQCRVDLTDGKATLAVDGDDMKDFRPSAATPCKGAGKRTLIFANCDRQLYLWVDGVAQRFDASTSYPDLKNDRPTLDDLSPVGIGVKGASVAVRHIKVFRDIYYTAISARLMEEQRIGATRQENNPHCDFMQMPAALKNGERADEFFASPEQWGAFDDKNMATVSFPLGKNQFFAMGDNSPSSADSRLWSPDMWWVDRDLLIGKAFFVYWPHSKDRLPGINVPFWFFPDFADMKFVR